MKRRDMTKKEFDRRCALNGFTTDGFMGYYHLPCGTNVSILNAGPTRREQLQYLIDQQKRISEQMKDPDYYKFPHLIKRSK